MHSHLAKMLGQYILDERIRQNHYQKDVAKVLKMSPQFLGRIEKGEVMIPEPALKEVICFLNLNPARLTKIFRIAATNQVSDILKTTKTCQDKRKARA